MKCKHNRLFCENGKIFCYHCGLFIRDDKTCEQKTIIKPIANTIMEVDAPQKNQMEENIHTACRRHVLDLNQGDEINMSEPKCKMSIDEADNRESAGEAIMSEQSQQPFTYRQCFGHYLEGRCLIHAMVHGDCDMERQCKEQI